MATMPLRSTSRVESIVALLSQFDLEYKSSEPYFAPKYLTMTSACGMSAKGDIIAQVGNESYAIDV